MSSGTLRGFCCLVAALAILVGVSIWTYQQTKAPAVVIGASKAGKEQKGTTPALLVAQQPKPNEPVADVNEPNPVPPVVEQPLPFNNPPRFFQKGGGKGFGRKSARVSLSDRLGVRLDKPSEDTVLQLGIAETDGLIVENVFGGSIAESAGMKVGDVLLTFDGRNVPSDVDQFHFQLEDVKTNQAIDAVVLRDGKMETLKGFILPEAPQPRSFLRKLFDN